MDLPVMQGSTKRYEIPLGHLDFSYINNCADIKELEKIYRVLKSKEEGHYEQLERCCEEKIKELNPNSRLLRKEIPLSSKGDLELDERQQLDEDLKSWTSNMKYMDSGVKGEIIEGQADEPELPPIRSGSITLTADGAKSNKPVKSNKRVMPREYRDWDKIDVDKELEKVDEADSKVSERTFIGNREMTNLPETVDTTGLSEAEKRMKADREKDKGNEAFRSNDFKEAITYYSRSIFLFPTAASYNNRALARLKFTQWQEAIDDVNTVLKMEPDNVKALMRRGMAYKGLKCFDKSRRDLEAVVSKEPNNKKAQDLLAEVAKEKQEIKKKGRRMKIQEVEEGEEGETTPVRNGNSDSKGDNFDNTANKEGVSEQKGKDSGKTARRMKIEEVDDEEEKETEISVNGNLAKEVISEEKVISKQEATAKDIWGDYDGQTGKATVGKQRETPAENVFDNSEQDLKSNKNGTVESLPEEKDPSKKQIAVENVTKEGRESPVAVEKDYKPDSTETDESDTSEHDDATNGTENNTEDENNTGTESEDSKPAPVQHIKRPVFFMTEYPTNCVKLKEEATKYFKNGQYGEAALKYTKIIEILEKTDNQIVNLSLMLSNRAACHLKIGELPGAVKDCSASLGLVPHSVKPLCRRASAYEHLERFDRAYCDYRHVLLLDSRVDQAHLGTKRCQDMLQQKDGPKWRHKLHPPKVNPTEIPEIVCLDGKSIGSVVLTQPPVTSQSQESTPVPSQSVSSNVTPVSQSQPPTQKSSQSEERKSKPIEKDEKPKERSKPTPQQQFDALKAQGNEAVKKGNFRVAAQLYTQCEGVLPDQTVTYTNRALCYIRLNQTKEAEADCSKALTLEKDNVKALFRRAQARKMLKKYREGIEDLSHLLKVDPSNAAAKKEMEVLKNYWRQELQEMKDNIEKEKKEKAKLEKQSKSNQSEKGSKPRKRMVIEEVESDEESSERGTTHEGGQKSTKDPSSKGSKNDTSKPQIQEVSEQKPPATKPTKQSTKQSTSKDEQKEKKQQKKSTTVTDTITGLPSVPKSGPKLDKATPFEFISAWNALKKSETVEPYYDLLKQIKPSDIKTVISNKLDGSMLNIITRCVAEHYLPNGENNESYAILKNLSTVPRFGFITMFMSAKDKTDVESVMSQLTTKASKVYNSGDIQALRKSYGL
ncbi:sperm-associated antigen 1-like [Mya arenaria]|uniref:sperm-associated antigen 1-like n=1 Tax=Mya arenaria TaxID=6604 RepID=UPI0022E1BABF|nr:sperm-associated antigen 1-like [Mya arenaria]